MLARLAERIRGIEPFLAMEVMERAFAMERDGRSVIHLEIGEPGFAPPPAVLEACAAALARGETRYTDSRGLAELREAIAIDKSSRSGVPVDPECVIVTSGTSPAMLLVFSLLIETGDEVILPTPHYPCYPNFIRYCGGTPVPVVCDASDGYRIHPDAVRRELSERTRAVMVASPANPTGAVQGEEVLRELAGLGIPLISDEIYDGLVYDGARVISALEVSPEAFVLDGFSKRYAMTGFRLGYLVAPRRHVRTLQTLQQNLFISANHFVQRAGIAALEQGAETVRAMRDAYERRRRILVGGLRELGFAIPELPKGAFYVLADARAFARDSRRLAFDLLERTGVATTPGVDFGEAAEGHLRFCYAAPESQIADALERLVPALRDTS